MINDTSPGYGCPCGHVRPHSVTVSRYWENNVLSYSKPRFCDCWLVRYQNQTSVTLEVCLGHRSRNVYVLYLQNGKVGTYCTQGEKAWGQGVYRELPNQVPPLTRRTRPNRVEPIITKGIPWSCSTHPLISRRRLEDTTFSLHAQQSTM